MYSSSLANESLCFLIKLPRLFDHGYWVRFNFHLLYIILDLFLVSIGGFELVFDFLFALILKLIYVYFLLLVFHFYLLFHFLLDCHWYFFFYWVSFGDLWRLFWCGWLFHQDLLCPLDWMCWIMGLVHLLVFLVLVWIFFFFFCWGNFSWF